MTAWPGEDSAGSSATRTPSSMSVASSSARPSSTLSRTPASVWIALRVEAPRTAMPSLARNVSRETVSFKFCYLTLKL